MKHAILNEKLYIQMHYNAYERNFVGHNKYNELQRVKTEYVLDKNGIFSWNTLPKF